jgi:uncharacterized protein with FMN-binding domain
VTRLGQALTALFVANAAAVIAIWWTALDPRSLDSLAAWLNALGRITGLVATYLILVQLILRTHVPWLVTAFGKDFLKAWHTRNAWLAFGLLGAHVVFQLVGYALVRGIDVVSELVTLAAYYEGMLLAIASFVLLALLTILGLERFRHGIPWPTWRALHLYTYVAVALSVPHQIATGSDFIDAPIAVAYWAALVVVVTAILLAARLPSSLLAARVPSILTAIGTAGRPHPAVVAVGAAVIATYLLGTVRLSPDLPAAAAAPVASSATTRPSPSASPSAVRTPSSAVGETTLAILGDIVETPYGDAQVRAIVRGGTIVDVEPVLLPSATKRSKTISTSAEYWLRKRAIAAQSAEFDVLSGATYTSRAYQDSLESALRAAGLAR